MSVKNSIKKFFKRVGDSVLGLRNLPQKLADLKEIGFNPRGEKEGNLEKPSAEDIPSLLQSFFRDRDAGWPEYIMFKAQINVVLLFILAAILVLTDFSTMFLIFVLSLLTVHAAYLTVFQLRKAFSEDFPAYRSFMLMCAAIAWSTYPLLEFLPTLMEERILEVGAPVAVLMVGSIGAFITFRVKYGRDHTYGVVEEVHGDRAKVRIGYDLRSNVKHGIYFVNSFVPVEQGDKVKIEVSRSTLGMTGSSVEAIVEKIK
ncbi:MAG: DUF2101 family protein [Candidatus Hadarchaeia archaeon]